MIKIDVPGLGQLEIQHFVTDFSGTLSEDGEVLPGVRERLNELSDSLKVHILTSDTFGRARKELEGVNCILHVLEGEGHTAQKEQYVLSLGPQFVVAMGNGNNDAGMLKAASLSIAVCLKEGCAVEAMKSSDILITSPLDAIDLLLNPKRLVATLRI
ncbi:MAG: Haloacid dehalogenase domain protein hydrolase type 3 [Nitrospirae bacterium]|nr:Haloacid dehalogenase domain protein hydrolase type 3 [Nitrospirota bacterium]